MSDKWQIIGAGAIGCLWAANLIRSGQQVHLVSRHKQAPQSITYQNLQAETTTLDCSQSSTLSNSVDPIIVCVKAPQVRQALLDQHPYISAQQVIILMHNGMGAAEQVAEKFPNNPIICATTANACWLHRPFDIQQTGLGITYLGPFNESAKAFWGLTSKLNHALDNCHWYENIEEKLCLKLLINIAINPLTAIHQINNGKLAQSVFQEQINSMMSEAIPVLKSLGLDFDKTQLLDTINDVITATADNCSSMNRDIYFQRPSENEYINGYLLKKASQHNIEIPFIESLYQQVKVLENRSLTPLNTG